MIFSLVSSTRRGRGAFVSQEFDTQRFRAKGDTALHAVCEVITTSETDATSDSIIAIPLRDIKRPNVEIFRGLT